ncbi:MAG: AI-2E family transporter [Halofilum sp. (in: g-proteobacteria)]
MNQSTPRTASTILTVLALTITAYFLPYVVSVLLLFFSGTVLAVLLDAITGTAQRYLPGGRTVGLLAMSAAVLLAVVGVVLWVVPQLVTQVPELVQQLPEAWQTLRTRIQNNALLQPMLARLGDPAQWLQSSGVLGRATSVVSGAFDLLFNAFVITFIGMYLVVAPDRYQAVAVYPLHPQHREKAQALFGDLGRELRFWLAGRAISMATVGVATALGLYLLGVPLAFTLGLLAGLFSFVPYLGPVLALLPALLIAFAESATLAGWVLLLYAIVQVLETYLLTPLVQQRTTAIPPALLITAQLLGGVFGGLLGILMAAPLAVTSATVFRRVYIEPRDQALARSD